ncbi:MAG TPA: IS630 family transposase [Chloroflexota bacterium]|jgi:transposase
MGGQDSLDLDLTEQERRGLQLICRTGKAQHRLVSRAQIILTLDHDESYHQVAYQLGLSRTTVRLWGRRFAQGRIIGLRDRPRSGRPPVFSSEARTQLIGLACRDPRDEGCEADRWTLDLLVETALRHDLVSSMHRTTMAQLLHQGAIQPHRYQMWLHSKDPLFREKIAAIVPLYLHHQVGETVLCIDEKTGIQALQRPVADRRPAPNRDGRREFEYIRHGTLTLFAARNVHSGQVTGWCQPFRRRVEFVAFLDRLAAQYPRGRVHCVLDNLNTHYGPEVSAWLKRHRGRFVFHFTPYHASWVNQIECWFSILSRQLLRYASFVSLADLETRIMAYITRYNGRAGPFKWTWKGYPLVA